MRSLHRLARDMSAVGETPAPFLCDALVSITRWSKLLVAVFDDLILFAAVGDTPRSASLCLRNQEFEREIVPEILEEVGINDPTTCS